MTNTPKTKPKRRFLRFSLRTLLIVMLLFGVVLVPFAVKLQLGRRRTTSSCRLGERG